MDVVVLGAGVIGVCQAWYLAQAGWRVTVIERQVATAMETSFANGGQISPCHAQPWANPSVFGQMVRWFGRKDAPLLVHWGRWDPQFWSWGLRFLGNCTTSNSQRNMTRALRVALYSRQSLQDLRHSLDLNYHQKTLGILHIYRDSQQFNHAQYIAKSMQDNGLIRHILDQESCLSLEPALRQSTIPCAGGIHTPEDESGDAHSFTQQLAEKATEAGVRFLYNHAITGLRCRNQSLEAIETNQGEIPAHIGIVACGSYSPHLLRPLGLKLPIIPAKGYSLTIPITGTAPQISLIDDAHKMVYSRLGNRLRVAGTAEFSGYNTHLSPQRWQSLCQRAEEIFPNAGDYHPSDIQELNPWCGLRPSTPDGVPILGKTPIKGLYLNTGHGTLGWTMACGSGKLLCDIISGIPPAIPYADLGLTRFS